MRWVFGLILALVPGVLSAQGLAKSPRPMPRPALSQAGVPAVSAAAILRPKPRPHFIVQSQPPLLQVSAKHPAPRPSDLGKSPKTHTQKSLKGAVCGHSTIRGTVLAAIKSKTKGCGIQDPVSVTEIGGVGLKPAATINCTTATALEKWMDQAMQPAFGAQKVVQLQIAASYACRGRNNVKGARISEHGRGNAIDIAGFVFADGKVKTVLHNFDKSMRKAHKGACGIFGTTLGPGSDGYHENHMHFDVARYRGGSYCR